MDKAEITKRAENIKRLLQNIKDDKLTTNRDDRDLKIELTRLVFASNNDYLVNDYYKDHESFKRLVHRLGNSLNSITPEELHLISFICRIGNIELDFLMNEI